MTINLELTADEAQELLDFLIEAPYPHRSDTLRDIKDMLQYELEEVEPLEFETKE